jgi:hypothetical protein
MTAQGKHRPQPRTELVPFMVPDHWTTLTLAAHRLECKGYEVRQVRLTVQDHGHKTLVVLYLSPAPVKAWQIGGPKRPYSKHVNYAGQDVGATHRRNIETLLSYVEGLPNVRRDVPGGDGPLPQPV